MWYSRVDGVHRRARQRSTTERHRGEALQLLSHELEEIGHGEEGGCGMA
jgi:hypothetical protein